MYNPGAPPGMISEQTQNICYPSLNLAGKKKIKNNFCCQLYENNTCILTANDLKMKTDQQCNVLGVGGGRALENPEVCISKLSAFTSSMYLPHLQFYAPSSVFFQSFSL